MHELYNITLRVGLIFSFNIFNIFIAAHIACIGLLNVLNIIINFMLLTVGLIIRDYIIEL